MEAYVMNQHVEENVVRVAITAADLTEAAAATAQTIEAWTVAKGTTARLVGMELEEAFEDASDGAFNTTTLKVGDGDDDDRYLASTQLNANGSQVDFSIGTLNKRVYLAGDTIDAIFGSQTGKSLADIDTGRVVLVFAVQDLSAI
jgi:hypothetical protein